MLPVATEAEKPNTSAKVGLPCPFQDVCDKRQSQVKIMGGFIEGSSGTPGARARTTQNAQSIER